MNTIFLSQYFIVSEILAKLTRPVAHRTLLWEIFECEHARVALGKGLATRTSVAAQDSVASRGPIGAIGEHTCSLVLWSTGLLTKT